MRRRRGSLILLLALSSLTHGQAQQRTVVKPVDTGEALVNPAMGWAFHLYGNNIVRYGLDLEPSDTVDDFPGASEIYLRPAITLKDAKGGIVGDESFDVRALPVGPPGKALAVGRQEQGLSQADRPLISYALPHAPIFKPGTYDVFISVGDKTGSPKIALPLAGNDGHRRYRLNKIVVR